MGAKTHVWIPPDTDAAHRALLPSGIELHDLPPAGEPARHLGPGQFVVVDFYRRDILDVIERLEGVRVVQTMSAGVERLVGRIPDGAVLCNASGVHDIAVAEWTVMAILAMRRGLPDHVLHQHEARWVRPGEQGMRDLDGSRVLIVGYGSIGTAVEARLLPFGATVDRVARRARDGVSGVDRLPDLLAQADVVVILMPLTPQTEHFVNAVFLAHMRPGALLVNAARGKIVDTEALIDAIRERGLRVALDVTDPEPLPDGHPLWTMDGVLITPHIGGSVERGYDRAWKFVVEQLGRYLASEPLANVVRDGY